MKKTFDVIVIGSGSAGFSAAERANQLGKSVCVIEADAWGGECPNYACVPTKALLKSAEMYHNIKHLAPDLGVRASGLSFNFSKIMQRKQEIVDVVTGNGKRLKAIAKDLGITTIKGRATFIDEHTVIVGKKKIHADRFVIATGAVDFVPQIEGISEFDCLTYKDVVALKKQPKSIAIIGGGPVGCEFATFFSMLGTRVHVFQIAERILHREDTEISLLAKTHLENIGTKIHVNSMVKKVSKKNGKITVSYEENGLIRKVTVTHLLLAAGKRPNIQTLELENAKVELDKKGRIILNKNLQTTNKNIFAAGDVTGGMMFTHTAHEEGYIAGTNVSKKSIRTMENFDLSVVPRITFVHPEVASVGLTSKEAFEKKYTIIIASFPVGALSRAVTEGRREGVVKLIVNKKTRKILGGHIIAARAGEMIHEVALAMKSGVTVDALAELVHAFPTYSEAVAAAASRA